jgi:hypothetical protein
MSKPFHPRFLLFPFLILMIFTGIRSNAQVKEPKESDTVNIRVDMGFMVASGLFHPLTDTVELEGTMNPDTIKIMEFSGTSYIYQLTYVLPVQGFYTYHFRINTADTVYVEEADPSTRAFRVSDTTQTILNYYSNYNPGLIPMIFDCNMYYQIHAGHFSPALDYLDVAGNFNDWGGQRLELFPRSADSIYSCTIWYDTAAIPVAGLQFKFRFNGDTATMELKGQPDRVYYMTKTTNHFTCWYDNLDPNVPALPFVYNVTIQDSIVSKHTVTGAYNYEDYNLKPEGNSIYQWYTATESGGVLTPIDSAWNINYTIDSLLIGKYLIFEVTPLTIDSIVGLPVQAWSPGKIVGVGLDELELPSARIYPNPVHDVMTVELLRSGKVIEIRNVFGQRIFSWEINRSGQVSIDLSHLDDGIYFLRILNNQNAGRTYKIIKD